LQLSVYALDVKTSAALDATDRRASPGINTVGTMSVLLEILTDVVATLQADKKLHNRAEIEYDPEFVKYLDGTFVGGLNEKLLLR
jgi:hypothetical protein